MPFAKSKDSALVTVIIPVHNGQDYIGAAITSIIQQSFAELTLVIVDDASTDATAEIVRSYTDSRIQFIQHTKCMGVSASRNHALDITKTPYVAFLDADDIAYMLRLEKQIEYLENNRDVVLIGSLVDYIDSHGELLFSEQIGQRPSEPAVLRMELLKRACILPSTATGLTAAIKEAGGFPRQNYAEDHDLWCRLATKHDLAIFPERLVAYRQHANQATFQKIRASYKATQACIFIAWKSYQSAGLLPLDTPYPLLSLGERIRGKQGSLGYTYLQWAELYSWALKQPRQAWKLSWMAVLFSPLNMKGWLLLLDSTERLFLSRHISRALRWYAEKLLGKAR